MAYSKNRQNFLAKSLIFLTLTLSTLSLNREGVVNLFNNKEHIFEDNFISVTENFKNRQNGAKLSVFGWFKITKDYPDNHPIFKLSTSAEKETHSNPVLNRLALLGYSDREDLETPQLFLLYAETPTKLKKVEIPFKLEKNVWIFMSYAFDYKTGVVQLFVNYQHNSQEFYVKEKFTSDFSDFELKQFMVMHVGCFPVDSDTTNVSSICMKGKAQQFSYMLDYVDRPELLFLLDSDYETPRNFTFDFYNYEKRKQLVFAKSGTDKPLEVEGELTFLKTEFIQRGKSQFRMRKVELLDPNKAFNAPSFYFSFNYIEPLPQRYRILQVAGIKEDITINVYLVQPRDQKMRFLDFEVEGTNFGFRTKEIFQAGIMQRFTLSMIQESELFWIMFDHPLERVISNKRVVKLLTTSDVVFFQKDNEFLGGIKVVQVSLLNNAAGVVKNFLTEGKAQETPVCKVAGNFNFQYNKCIECDRFYVLQPEKSKCASFCPYGFKNIGGVCQRCEQATCPELEKKFFNFEQLAQNEITIGYVNDVYLHDQNFYDIFDVLVEDKEFMKDYFFNVFKQESGWVVKFEFKDQSLNHTIKMKLRESARVHSLTMNEIPLVQVEFNSLSKSTAPSKEIFRYESSSQAFTLPRKQSDQEKIKSLQAEHEIEIFPYFPQKLTNETQEIMTPIQQKQISEIANPSAQSSPMQTNVQIQETHRQKLIKLLKSLRAKKVEQLKAVQEKQETVRVKLSKEIQKIPQQSEFVNERSHLPLEGASPLPRTDDWYRMNGFIMKKPVTFDKSQNRKSLLTINKNPTLQQNFKYNKKQYNVGNKYDLNKGEFYDADGFPMDGKSKKEKVITLRDLANMHIRDKEQKRLEQQMKKDFLSSPYQQINTHNMIPKVKAKVQDILHENANSQFSLNGFEEVKNNIPVYEDKLDYMNSSNFQNLNTNPMRKRFNIEQMQQITKPERLVYHNQEYYEVPRDIPVMVNHAEIANSHGFEETPYSKQLNEVDYPEAYHAPPQKPHETYPDFVETNTTLPKEKIEKKSFEESMLNIPYEKQQEIKSVLQRLNEKMAQMEQNKLRKEFEQRKQIRANQQMRREERKLKILKKLKQIQQQNDAAKQLAQLKNVKEKNMAQERKVKEKEIEIKVRARLEEMRIEKLKQQSLNQIKQRQEVVKVENLNKEKIVQKPAQIFDRYNLRSAQKAPTVVKTVPEKLHRTFQSTSQYNSLTGTIPQKTQRKIQVPQKSAVPIAPRYNSNVQIPQAKPLRHAYTQPYSTSNYQKNIESDTELDFENAEIGSFPRTFATIMYAIVVIGLVCGFLLMIIKVVKNDTETYFFQKMIQFILFAQYFAFWAFYSDNLPPRLKEFLSRFYELLIGNNQIWKTKVGKHHSSFEFSYLSEDEDRLHAQNVNPNFLTNFGLIFVIQLLVITLYVVLKWVQRLYHRQAIKSITQGQKDQKATFLSGVLREIIQTFEFKILFSLLMVFSIQSFIFSVYNLSHLESISAYTMISFIIAIFYGIAVVVTPIITQLSVSPSNQNSSCAFMFKGLEKGFLQRNFRFLQYYYFLSFGLSLVLLHSEQNLLIIVNYVIFLLLTCFTVFGNVIQYESWNYEQIFVYLTTLLAKTLLMIQVLSGKSYEFLDNLMIYLIFLVMLESSLLMILQFLQEFGGAEEEIENEFKYDHTVEDDDEIVEIVEIIESKMSPGKITRLQKEIEELVENQKAYVNVPTKKRDEKC